jgi:LacI family sucrose operon transcriptional repressor
VQAQMLRTQKNRQIGVVLPKLSSESVARVMDGISAVLAENGLSADAGEHRQRPRQGGGIAWICCATTMWRA